MKSHTSNTSANLSKPCSALFALALLVSACGGGSGDSDPSNNQSGLIPGESSTGDVSALSDDQILQNAADNAAGGLGVNLGGISRLATQEQADDSSVVGEMTDGSDTQAIDDLDESSDNFIVNSLGIDDTGARITRDGNVITIDPDDQTLCDDDIPLAPGINNDSSCLQLVSDLTVQVTAESEETGVISYLFQDTPVLLIGYSPIGGSFEISLDGLLLVSQRADALQGDTSSMNSILSGTVRLEALISNDEPGSEAGTLSLKVTEAISIGAVGEENQLSLEPSTVFDVAFDEATQDVSMDLDWGALQIVGTTEDSDDNPSILSLDLGGLSAEIDTNTENPSFQISNIGIGGVPLTVTIDSIESLNLTLANFGVSIDEQSDTITLDGALNASLMLNNLAGLLEDQAADFSVDASVSAPGATVFTPQENGSTQVTSGGPLNSTLIGGDGTSSGQSEVMINAGECVDTSSDDDSSSSPVLFSAVPCN